MRPKNTQKSTDHQKMANYFWTKYYAPHLRLCILLILINKNLPSRGK
jgi:hypothetical protein